MNSGMEQNGGEGAFRSERMDSAHPNWQTAVRRAHTLYPRNNDIRSEFDRDYTRILHCGAYRRLKHKTQVFFAPKNDHVCTRMEHAAHVASVSTTIAKYLGLNEELTRAIALGHDIGHAPFGHHGETCLNMLLEQKDGVNAPKRFWHERNSLFFADYIETLQDPDGALQPLNLTYAVRDGIICHCGEIHETGVRPRSEETDLYGIRRAGAVQPYTWEGCVVKIADTVASLGRDMEDARIYHILDMGAYRELKEIVAETIGFGPRSGRAVNTTVLINDLIVDLCRQSSPERGLCFSAPYCAFISRLRQFNTANIYNHWRLREFERYAANVLRTIHDALLRTFPFAASKKIPFCLKRFPRLLETFEDWLVCCSDYDEQAKRTRRCSTPAVFSVHDEQSYRKCIIEYISGMTDQYAIQIYEEIISF